MSNLAKPAAQQGPIALALKLIPVLVAGVLLLGTTRPSARTFYEQGERAFSAGSYRTAVDRYTRAVERNPGYARAFVRLGLSYERLGEPGQARRSFSRARSLQPENMDALLGVARANLALGNLEEVRKSIDEASRVRPGDAGVGLLRGQLALALNRPALALRHFERILRGNPGSVAALRAGALALSRMGRHSEAAVYIRRARRIEPVNPEVHRTLGLVRLEEALRMPPGTERDAALEAAHESLRTSVQLSSGEPELELKLLWIELVQGNRSAARARAERLLAGQSSAVAGRYLPVFAMVLDSDSERRSAALLRRLLEQSPRDSLTRYRLETGILGERNLFEARGALRANLAAYHRGRTAYYERRRLTDRRDFHLARALDLSGGDAQLMQRKLELARLRGDFGTFVTVLGQMVASNPTDVRLRYRLDTALRKRSADLAYGARQRLGRIQSEPVVAFIFDLEPRASMPYHPDGGRLLSSALELHLGREGRMAPVAGPLRKRARAELAAVSRVSARSVASELYFTPGRLARSASVEGMETVDFFVGGRYSSSATGVTAHYDVYDARTGRRVASFAFEASGRDAIHEVSARAAKALAGLSPARGRVVEVSRRGLLVNAGGRSGIDIGDKLLLYESNPSNVAPLDGAFQTALTKASDKPYYCTVSRVAARLALCTPDGTDEDIFHRGQRFVLMPRAVKADGSR